MAILSAEELKKAEQRAVGETGESTTQLVAKLADKYKPFISAYAEDAANDKGRSFTEAAKNEKATITGHFLLRERGALQRMPVQLNPAETKEYAALEDTEKRGEWFSKTLREKAQGHVDRILSRLRESGSLDAINALDEAFLRQVGVLEDNPAFVDWKDVAPADRMRLREAGKADPQPYVLRESIPDTPNPMDWPALYGSDQPNLGGAPRFMDGAYLPYGAGPFGQQMYLQAQWDMLAKAFALSCHHPVAIAALSTKVDFVIDTGVKVKAKDDALDGFLQEFWKRNKMQPRSREWAWDWYRDGEIFVRPIPLRDGTGRTKVRSADPTTIWEVSTADEDIEDVKFYRQQYQVRTQLYSDSGSAKYIVRDFAPEEIVHRKINVGSAEVRGRSDLASVLGWLALLNDFFETVVGKERASAAVGLDVAVKGGPGDLAAVQSNLVLPSADNAGSANVHSDSVTITPMSYTPSETTGAGSTFEGLMTMCANGLRVPRTYLNAGGDDMTRAGTLTATAPFAKHALTRQAQFRELIETLLTDVITEGKKAGALEDVKDWSVDIEFPEIVTADIDKFVELLEEGIAMDFLSHETAAGLYAIKLDVKGYDYQKQQSAIKADRNGDEWKGIWKNFQIVPRMPIAPTGGGQKDGEGQEPSDTEKNQPLSQAGEKDIRRASESVRVRIRNGEN